MCYSLRLNIKNEIESLLSESIEVSIAVALCSNYAVEALQKMPRDCKLRIVTGVNLPTPLEVLKTLKNKYKKNARIYKDSFFHPKVYIFRLKEKGLVAYIGSGNFTEGGLLNNIEAFFKIDNQEECNFIMEWFDKIFNDSIVITDDFLIDYNEYSKEWSKEEKRRKKQIKDILSEINKRKELFEGLKNNLKELRTSERYKQICKERDSTVKNIREAIDYDNAFQNINIDEFFRIKELGNIRQSYKKELKAAVKSHELKELFMMLCDEDKTIEERYKAANEEYKIFGCSKNIITKVLTVHNPHKYMLWNGATEQIMRNYNIRFERRTKDHEKYSYMCSEFKEIIDELDIKDFVVLDLMLLYI